MSKDEKGQRSRESQTAKRRENIRTGPSGRADVTGRRTLPRKLKQMGRRRFVSKLSALGISASALVGMSSEALAEVTENPKKEVPRLTGYKHTNHEEVEAGTAPPEREPVHHTISRDRVPQTEATLEALEKVRKEYATHPSITVGLTSDNSTEHPVGLFVQIKERPVDGKAGPKSLPDVSTLRAAVPSTVSGKADAVGTEHVEHGILVAVEKTKQKQQLCDHADQSYCKGTFEPLPAGVEAGTNTDPECVEFSLATPAYSSNDNSYGVTTAAHCVNWENGTPVY